MSEDTHAPSLSVATNGDLPLDAIEHAVSELITAADVLRRQEDGLRTELEKVRMQRQRLDRAVATLTGEPKVTKAKPKGKARGPYNKSPRTNGDGITNAAEGYPTVSEEKQSKVLAILESFGRPVKPGEITGHPDFDMAKSTTQNALAHLRARGLVRWAGSSGAGGGHLYAVWGEGESEDVS